MDNGIFTDKTILITGGTGSFGKAVLERLLNFDLKEIRILSRDEKKQDDLRKTINNPKIKFYISDVRDIRAVDSAMVNVDYVFHAAALKQVPSCEFFPLEAIKTNVLGAENVMDSAIRAKVKKLIVLSTDKAVYPINAMGMTKALMEKVMVAKSRNLNNRETILCGTRYGNVMGSRGSVIPLFVNQIKSGNQLTITDPNMTRFMMSLDEAVDLVLFAFENGKQGDIFVQKSPAATIRDLANVIKELYNYSGKIRIIGTRHGEKLYETLVSKEEMFKAEELKNYYRIPSDTRDLNYDIYFEKGKKKFTDVEEYNSHNTYRLNAVELKDLLLDSLDFIRNDFKG